MIWKSVPARRGERNKRLKRRQKEQSRRKRERDVPAKIQLSAIVLMNPSADLLTRAELALSSATTAAISS